ncbi:MAG: adenylate kinase [Chlamydiae bacterium CG10_big_fil_rev_8_21_14_0_10_42_34]|nr:MAG: adenylate kinase [Chlamydiae bacterium CG10_big_fil_rev_8_21_14_0_10_42_34]
MLSALSAGETFTTNRSENKPLVIILMGPPGSGKGTHAGPLSQELHLPHISTGDLFREHIRGQTPLGVKAKEFIDKGQLVPDELVLDMLFDRVSRADCKGGYILDGFPRTIAQAKALDERIESNKVIALNFNLPDSTIIERITGRIACKECGRPYHKKFDPPKKEMVCDLCNGQIYQRADDCEEIVKKRLEVYRVQTEPLIEYYSKKSEVLHEIDSQNDKSQVFHDVIEAIPMAPAQ